MEVLCCLGKEKTRPSRSCLSVETDVMQRKGGGCTLTQFILKSWQILPIELFFDPIGDCNLGEVRVFPLPNDNFRLVICFEDSIGMLIVGRNRTLVLESGGLEVRAGSFIFRLCLKRTTKDRPLIKSVSLTRLKMLEWLTEARCTRWEDGTAGEKDCQQYLP